MKKIFDLNRAEVDFLAMKLNGETDLWPIKSYLFDFHRGEERLNEMRLAGYLDLHGQYPNEFMKASWNVKNAWICRFRGFQMHGADLLEAALKCYCAWKLDSEEVDDQLFKEMTE